MLDVMTGTEAAAQIAAEKDLFVRGFLTEDEYNTAKELIFLEWTLKNRMICYQELRKAYA